MIDNEGMKFKIAWTEQILGNRQINRQKMSAGYAGIKVRQNELDVCCRGASFEATVGTWNLLIAVRTNEFNMFWQFLIIFL